MLTIRGYRKVGGEGRRGQQTQCLHQSFSFLKVGYRFQSTSRIYAILIPELLSIMPLAIA